MKPTHFPRRRLPLWFATLFLILQASSFTRLFAAGFTEPPIVFYGKVSQSADGYSIDLTQGELTFTVQPSGGSPLTFTTSLDAIDGGYSYRLKIPVEKVPTGFTVTAGSISTPAASKDFARSATINGSAATITFPASPAGGTFTFAENQRGKIQRVDLALVAPFLDSDGDGLPDWWELLHGLDPFDPFDAISDNDGDTATALDEYRDHTDPAVYEFDYRRWAALHHLTGPNFPMTADPDGDGIPNGIEFGIGTDPNVPDAALAAARISGIVQPVAGVPRHVFTIAKPAQRRTRTAYVIEYSPDLVTWSSVEGSDFVTLQNTSLTLQVRSVQPALAVGVLGFFRLKIVDLP